MRLNKLCINTNEASAILGKSQSSARTLMRTIKDVNNKQRHHEVTIKEFCDYTDIPYDDVFNMINPSSKSA
ncbi:hypothetical protein [uncultured Lacinutrix sp.]|uniref:hypothetical protein n=1 Tax=uncultured Lacinutrix sp. TaxID=574032 RepID=UPI00261E63AF|nr:hypothetical protein [uncultured Lacinutrix sp.]